MRRTLAITMMLLCGLMLFAPIVELGSPGNLPACCRRGGQHHCMGQSMDMPGSDTTVAITGPKCPRFPMALVAPQAPGFVSAQAHSVGSPVFVRPASLPQTEARYRVSYARSRQKRGPPVLLS